MTHKFPCLPCRHCCSSFLRRSPLVKNSLHFITNHLCPTHPYFSVKFIHCNFSNGNNNSEAYNTKESTTQRNASHHESLESAFSSREIIQALFHHLRMEKQRTQQHEAECYDTSPTHRVYTSRREKLAALKNALKPLIEAQKQSSQLMQRIHFNSEERAEFSHLLECNTNRELSYCINKMNIYIVHANTKGRITAENKEFIHQWLKKHDFRMPTQEERKNLTKHTGISRVQLHTQLQRLKEINLPITDEAKEILSNWVEKYGLRMPTTQERKVLLRETKLSNTQIRQQLYRLIETKGSFTDDAKSIVRKFLETHNNMRPTLQQRRQLMQQTGLSTRQLSQALFHLKGYGSNFKSLEESKAILHDWMKTNNFRSPTAQEKADLVCRTGLTHSKMNSVLFRLKHPDTDITEAKRQIVQSWLESNAFRSPKTEEYQMLHQKTDLSLIQLYNMTYWMRDKEARRKMKRDACEASGVT
mmetsp:Transcript_9425/g.35010  ORF Transcript_9425/g.35010 Transcript_9425/m.35010 type:complete len:473 (-) Transcript_9425:127-1545(-)